MLTSNHSCKLLQSIFKSSRALTQHNRYAFSSQQQQDEEPQPYIPSEGSSGSDTDTGEFDSIRPKMDPVKGHLTDFLKNVSIYEE